MALELPWHAAFVTDEIWGSMVDMVEPSRIGSWTDEIIRNLPPFRSVGRRMLAQRAVLDTAAPDRPRQKTKRIAIQDSLVQKKRDMLPNIHRGTFAKAHKMTTVTNISAVLHSLSS